MQAARTSAPAAAAAAPEAAAGHADADAPASQGGGGGTPKRKASAALPSAAAEPAGLSLFRDVDGLQTDLTQVRARVRVREWRACRRTQSALGV